MIIVCIFACARTARTTPSKFCTHLFQCGVAAKPCAARARAFICLHRARCAFGAPPARATRCSRWQRITASRAYAHMNALRDAHAGSAATAALFFARRRFFCLIKSRASAATAYRLSLPRASCAPRAFTARLPRASLHLGVPCTFYAAYAAAAAPAASQRAPLPCCASPTRHLFIAGARAV